MNNSIAFIDSTGDVAQDCSNNLCTFIDLALLQGVEVTLHEDIEVGLFELHARPVGSKNPAGTKIQVKDVSLFLNTPADLNYVFSYLINNTLACNDDAPRGEWRAVS